MTHKHPRRQNLTVKPYYKLTRYFIPKHASRMLLAEASENIRAIAALFATVPRYPFLLVKNPKAGTSTLASFLYQLQTGQKYHGDVEIHSEREHIRQGGKYAAENFSRLKAPNVVVFSSVRHPQDRCLSGFWNFVVKATNATLWAAQPQLKAAHVKEGDPSNENLNRFLDMVEADLKENGIWANEHWRPQYVNLGSGEIKIDMTLRVEAFEQELPELAKRLGLSDVPQEASFNVRKNSTSRPQYHISKSIKSRIEILYSKDFEEYQYDSAS